MNKLIKILMITIMLIIGSTVVLAGKPSSCPIQSNTDIVYYSGSGAGSLSVSWMEHFLSWWQGQDSSISYMDLSAREVQDCDFENYDDLDLYIQPGGNAYLAQKYIGSTGKNKINNWINNNGAYFGVCAGWYYASADYYWQGDYYDHSNLLGAYPATTEGSIKEIADYDQNPGYAMSMLDNGFNALYYGGPTIGYEQTSYIAGTVDSRHSYMDLPAVVKYNNMLLTSVHLEAYENDGFTGLSTDERIENYKYLANLINEVAGTNFYVPAYNGNEEPILKQCEDGLDNDGDGLFDYPQDPGCSSATDDDETDTIVVDPTDVLNDGFENGLDLWTTYGTGTSFSLKTDYVKEGSYSLGVKKTGAGKYSYVETSFDLSSYNNIVLDYSRKLKGLDAADDFGVEYFDTQWHYIEHLDSDHENGDFVDKTYIIPNTATKLRFSCEAGAVSEGCWIDNVKLVTN